MNSFVEQFVPYVSKDICWDVNLNIIKGFTNEQIDAYAKSLNIEAHGDLKLWLQAFGKCSGGFFTSEDFFLFDRRDRSSNQTALSAHGNMNQAWQQGMMEDDLITEKELDGKAYFFSHQNETSYYFIYTKDPELLVWHYCDGDDTFECTNMRFVEYLKHYLSHITCKKGIWINAYEILQMSTSEVF